MHAPEDLIVQAEDQQPGPAATPQASGTGPADTPGVTTATAGAGAGSPGPEQERRMIPVADLAAHPANVRTDLNLTREFSASISAEGVRIPLLITPGPDGTWRVIEGHRRLAAAIEAGLTEVPCDIDPARAGDEAGQYLDMALANSDAYRTNYTPGEEAAALFAAHEAGASRTRLRKATGRTAAEVKTALAAGSLPADIRSRAQEACEQVSLDDLALLAEFDGDTEATEALLGAIEYGYPLEHIAQRVRHQKAEAAEHARICDELEAAGFTVSGDLPDGACWLDDLTHDGEILTPEAHAECPGRGATFRSWNLLEPRHYCSSPAENAHQSRWATAQVGPDTEHSDNPLAAASGQLTGTPGQDGDPPAPSGPDRRLVVAGNKAWEAAAVVRHRWITDSLLARRAAPREVHEFLARQLLAMPQPLDHHLSGVRHRSLFSKLTGNRDTVRLAEDCGTATAGRLGILALAPVVAAYEQALTEGEGRSTWRTDRYSPCPRSDAGIYLTFLAGLGYRLSDIERAVADGVPYTRTKPLAEVLGEVPVPAVGPETGPADEDAALEPDAVSVESGSEPAGVVTADEDSEACRDDPAEDLSATEGTDRADAA